MSFELFGNKQSTDFQKVRIVGEKVNYKGEDWVYFNMGHVGGTGVSIWLRSGEEMTWDMLKERVKEARGKYQKGVPFEPSDMLASTGGDFSDL